MRVVVTGAGGLVGSALVPALAAAGHEIVRLVRRAPRAADEREWAPDVDRLDAGALDGADAVVHLAGESIAAGRWTATRKVRILESRTRSTRLLASTLARNSGGPRALICASGVGYYGDRGDEVLSESSGSGGGFLAEVVRAWEEAAAPAAAAGVRVVQVRTGMVVARGGALGPLVPLYRAGLGGPVAGGRQWVSWIALADIVAIYRAAIERGDLAGPINGVSPNPLRQSDFARVLGRVLKRPAWMPTPAFALRLVLGEMARELLIFSQRAIPSRLAALGHAFRYPDLGAAIEVILKDADG